MWNDFRHYKIAFLSTKFKFSRNYFEITWESQFLIFDSSKFVQTFAKFWSKIGQNCYFWDIESHHFQNQFRFPTLESSIQFSNPILDALLGWHLSNRHVFKVCTCNGFLKGVTYMYSYLAKLKTPHTLSQIHRRYMLAVKVSGVLSRIWTYFTLWSHVNLIKRW